MANEIIHTLIVSQVYPPDVAAVGQLIAEAVEALVERGHRVTVVTSRSGYTDSSQKYPFREVVKGVSVMRLPVPGFGRRFLWLRMVSQVMFVVMASLWSCLCSKPSELIISTSPPMVGLVALVLHYLKGVPFRYWVMDLNPDQAIAHGSLGPSSLVVRLLRELNSWVLRKAGAVVVTDKYMLERIQSPERETGKILAPITVAPPWALKATLNPVSAQAVSDYRARLGLEKKLVFMYSGNMSLVSPISTLVQAAICFRTDERVAFVFIGDGAGRGEVEAIIKNDSPDNIFLLPYQPLDELAVTLSAADIHMVTMGDRMVGIIHPSKIYGAMAVGRPVLYCGPVPSPISDVVLSHQIGWRVAHGDITGAEKAIRSILETPRSELQKIAEASRRLLDSNFSRENILSAYLGMAR